MGNAAREKLEAGTYVRAKEQVWSQLVEEIVILNLTNSSYYGLNPPGAYLWQILEQPQTFSALEQKILEEYDVAPAIARDDLANLLQQMISAKLIEFC